MVISLLSSGYLIYFLAAVLPAVILMVYIYRKDRVEREPLGLLMRCILGGVLSALLAIVLEEFGEGLLAGVVSPDSALYVIISAFLVVALAEEWAKYIFLKRITWRNPNFNYRFDGVVYAVFVSLGFAAFENFSYVLGYGLEIAPLRAVFSIPGHMSFAVFMGAWYGRAKLLENWGDKAAARRNRRRGVLAAVFLHGFYDACALMETDEAALVFLAFVILLDIFVIRAIRKEARNDEPI